MTRPFAPSTRTRIRRSAYARYDAATVFAILDAGLLAHIGYVVDGAPYVTPTLYWREGDRLYWHGAAAGRLFREHAQPFPVCLVVSHVDGLVLARSSFRHSLFYRSVMAFGHAALMSDAAAKRRALDLLIDRLYPGHSRMLRSINEEELAATSVMTMTIEEASAKMAAPETRGGKDVLDKEQDYEAAVWAGVIPVHTTIGRTRPDERLKVDPSPPAHLMAYAEGAALDAVLQELAQGGKAS